MNDEPMTVADEIRELVAADIRIELEIDALMADEVRPRKEERKYIRDRLKALVTAGDPAQVVMDFTASG